MPPLSRVLLAGAALGIGTGAALFLPVIARGVIWGRNPSLVLGDLSLALACWYAVPFLALAFVGERFRWSPWIAGMAATLMVQLFLLIDVVVRTGGGVNFLLGPLAMISPVAITAMVLLMDWIANNPPKATQ